MQKKHGVGSNCQGTIRVNVGLEFLMTASKDAVLERSSIMRKLATAMLFSGIAAFSLSAANAGVHLNVQVVPPVYSGYYEMDDGYSFSEPVYVQRVEPNLLLRVGPMVTRLGETRVIGGYHTRYYGYSPDLN